MADRAFRQLLLLTVVVAVPLVLALALTLFPGTVQRVLHGSDAFVQTCLAGLYGLGQRLPPVGIAILALALGAATAGSARALALVIRTRTFTSGCVGVPASPCLASITDRLGIAGRVVLFDAPVATAFTAGLLRPRIYVSTPALTDLGQDELEAVLLHERAHLERSDPLRIAVVRLLASALFFVPLAEELCRRFEVAKELDADRAVTATQRRIAPLAAALERLGGAAALRTEHLAVGAWSCASARIGQLEGAEVAALLPSAPARASWLTALALTALIALAFGQALRANIVPAAAWELLGAPMSASIHVCPLPLEGPLF